MTRWQDMYVKWKSDRVITIHGTDSATIKWLFTETQKRDPKVKGLWFVDAEEVVHEVDLELSRGHDSQTMLPVLKRLLCDQGWEPFATYGYYKRQIQPQ